MKRNVDSSAGALGRTRTTMKSPFIVPLTLLAFILVALFIGPRVLGLPGPNVQVLTDARLPPGAPGYLLGTDGLGRDVLARLLDGGRVSLTVGFSSVAIGFVVGGSLGVLAGYMGGSVDWVISRLIEILLSFPSLILALSIATFLGPSMPNLIIAISFYTIPTFARLARANTYRIRGMGFITAGDLAGARAWYMMRRHIAPLVVQTLVAYGLLAMGTAIIIEASLSFLGLGVPPPQATWGSMLSEGRSELTLAPHIAFAPAIMLFLTVLAINLLGDALRSRADRKVGAA